MVDVVEIVFRQRGAEQVGGSIGNVQKRASAASSTVGFLKRALVTLGAGVTAREVIQLADSFTLTQSRIRLVTNSTQELNQVQRALFDISQETRASFDSTAELYSRVARNADQLGLSQSDLLGVTQTVSKAIAVSGVSAESANAAIVQLGQGLASGALRGDELRSVLEQVPRLAQTIADGLGVTVGQLRELGSAGALTSERVVQAIQSQAPELAREFEQIPLTFGGAITQLGNSLQLFVGRANEGTGAISVLAEAVSGLADFIGSQETFDNIVAIFNNWSAAINSVISAFPSLNNEASLLSDIGSRVGDVLLDAFINFPNNIVTAVQVAVVQITSFIQTIQAPILSLFETVGNVSSAISEGDFSGAISAAREIDDIFERRTNIISTARDLTLDSIFQENDARKRAFEEEQERQRLAREQAEADRLDPATGGGPGQDLSALAEEQVSAEERRNQRRLENQQKFNEARLLALEESTLTERELEEVEFARKMQFLNEFNTGEVTLVKNRQALVEQLELQHNARLGKIEAQAALARQRFEKMTFDQRVKNVLSFVQTTTAGVANSNRTLFRINKAAAITSAVIDGVQGVAKTLGSYPFPINVGLAAVHAVSAAAQVAKIKSQQFGGEGGTVGSVSAGTGAAPSIGAIGSTVDNATSQFLGEEGEDGILQTTTDTGLRAAVTLNVERGIRDQNAIVELFEEMNEALGDNLRLDVRVA